MALLDTHRRYEQSDPLRASTATTQGGGRDFLRRCPTRFVCLVRLRNPVPNNLFKEVPSETLLLHVRLFGTSSEPGSKSAGPLVGPPGCRPKVCCSLHQFQLPISNVTVLLSAAYCKLLLSARGGEPKTALVTTPRRVLRIRGGGRGTRKKCSKFASGTRIPCKLRPIRASEAQSPVNYNKINSRR